jgi:hypothetical protein
MKSVIFFLEGNAQRQVDVRGSGGLALSTLIVGNGWSGMVIFSTPSLNPRERVPDIQWMRGWMGREPVWTS